MYSSGRGIIHPWLTSAWTIFIYSALYVIADLWLPRKINSLFLAILSSFDICSKGHIEPFSNMFWMDGQLWRCNRSVSNTCTGRNSDPRLMIDPGFAMMKLWMLLPADNNSFMLCTATSFVNSKMKPGFFCASDLVWIIFANVGKNHYGVSGLWNHYETQIKWQRSSCE